MENHNLGWCLCGCETWSVILREECRLRVLRKIFLLKRGEVTGENNIMSSFMICAAH
jgi:hypothetical protein